LKIAFKLTVTGMVHGVFFRASMREVARQHGVNGWVRNVVDGSVEALVEGDEEAVFRVLEWARHGPPSARVDSIRTEETPVRNLKGFIISG
jgi:acylphosphatase